MAPYCASQLVLRTRYFLFPSRQTMPSRQTNRPYRNKSLTSPTSPTSRLSDLRDQITGCQTHKNISNPGPPIIALYLPCVPPVNVTNCTTMFDDKQHSTPIRPLTPPTYFLSFTKFPMTTLYTALVNVTPEYRDYFLRTATLLMKKRTFPGTLSKSSHHSAILIITTLNNENIDDTNPGVGTPQNIL